MISAKEAYDLFLKANKRKVVTSMVETPTEFLFGTSDNRDTEGLDSINKTTKEIGTTWIWDLVALNDDDLKEVDISTFKEGKGSVSI